jgi:hypothetical protein
MNSKPREQANAHGTPTASGVEAALDAMGAAMRNREAVLRSLAANRSQVFKLLEAQREDVLKPMLRAKELLDQAKVSADLTGISGSTVTERNPDGAFEPMPDDPRRRLRDSFTNGLTVLLALQGAGGSAADAARERAVASIAEALTEFVETEIDRFLRC